MAAYFCIEAYYRYRQSQNQVAVMKQQLRLRRQQQQELKQKTKVLAVTKEFLQKTAAASVTKKNWTFYEVNIEEPITFPELSKRLDQCANSPAYYFKPERLHIKRSQKPSSKTKQKQASSSSSSASSEVKTGILLTIKGAFVVKQH